MVVSLDESGGAYRVLRVGVGDFFACRKNGGWAPMPPRGGGHGVQVVASVGSDPLNDMRPHQGNARSGREGVGASSASCCRGWFWGHGVVALAALRGGF